MLMMMTSSLVTSSCTCMMTAGKMMTGTYSVSMTAAVSTIKAKHKALIHVRRHTLPAHKDSDSMAAKMMLTSLFMTTAHVQYKLTDLLTTSCSLTLASKQHSSLAEQFPRQRGRAFMVGGLQPWGKLAAAGLSYLQQTDWRTDP